MRLTQHQRIINLLKSRPVKGATYHDMMISCGINWPHKRISELESRGYKFGKAWETSGNVKCLRFWLTGEPELDRAA